MGYALEEIKAAGITACLLKPRSAAARPIRIPWAKLNRGELLSGEFKRLGKNGKEIWILASYNPILDDTGRPFKVVKFASDVTERKLLAADTKGQLDAIKKSQAVIEFQMDGTIKWANPNFLGAVGYALGEIEGKRHGMFVEAAERTSPQYVQFWQALNRGEYQAGEYKRIAKGGREIWIEASYNPILDPNGKPIKVVKYATDVTAKAVARMKAEEARALIKSVAAGSEEMSASISRDFANDGQVPGGRRCRGGPGRVRRRAGHPPQRAADSMSGIIELIGNITSQINLLALNATMNRPGRERPAEDLRSWRPR